MSRYAAEIMDYAKAAGIDLASVETGISIDTAVAQRDACPECGGTMHYEREMSGRCYRAFAVCDDCGERIEF